MFFTREKSYNRGFFTSEKRVRPIKSHKGVWVSRQTWKFPPFVWRLQLASCSALEFLCNYSTRKDHKAEFLLCFLLKSEKHFGNWTGIVSYISLSIKKIVKSRQNSREKAEREVNYFLSQLFSNWPFFSNSFIFIWTLRTKVNMTWITLHPHKRFYWFTLFSLSFRDEWWQILAF